MWEIDKPVRGIEITTSNSEISQPQRVTPHTKHVNRTLNVYRYAKVVSTHRQMLSLFGDLPKILAFSLASADPNYAANDADIDLKRRNHFLQNRALDSRGVEKPNRYIPGTVWRGVTGARP